MNRRVVLALAVVSVLIAGALGARAFGLWPAGASTGLEMHGNIDIRQVDLGFRVGGRISTIAFDEGERVPAGAVLATLDPAPLTEVVAESEGVAAAAEADLAKLHHGNRAQDIAQAADRLAAAEAALAKARQDYDRRSGLVASGAVSKAVFDATAAALHSAEADAAAARAAAALMREGARAEDIDAGAARARQARAQADHARTDLADTRLLAPNAGVIFTRALEPGAIVQPGQTVLTETIDRPVRIRAYIAEPDLARITPGMAATITADGSAKTYHGTVAYIAPTAEFTPKTVQTDDLRADLVYRVRIIVTDPDEALRQGAPVTVLVSGARARADR